MRAEASLESVFARLGDWIARRPATVVLAFLAALVPAGLFGASVQDRLSAGGLEVPGSESQLAVLEAARHFGVGSADVLVLYGNPEGDVRDASFGLRIVDALDPVLADEGVVGAVTVYDTDEEALVSRDGRQTLVVLSLAGGSPEKLATFRRIEPLLRAVEPPVEVEIGGIVAFSILVQHVAEREALQAEAVALPIALLLTLLFFRSVVAALLPIAIGIFAIAASAALVRSASYFTEVSIFAMNVGTFLGLGLSIDYALLLVQRFREELRRRGETRQAVAATLDSAGRAVWISALAVAISLAALAPVPLPILRSIAVGGMLVVTCAALAALLLLPALLAWLGPNVNRGSLGPPPDPSRPSRFWRRVGTLSLRHPVLAASACVVALVTLASPVRRMESAMPDSRALARDSEVRRVDETLSDPERFDPGGASTVPVLVHTRGDALEPDNLRAVRAYADALARTPGSTGVRSPFEELAPELPADELARRMAREPTATKLRRMLDDDVVLLVVENPHPWRSHESAELVRALRDVPHPGLEVQIGGATAQMVDMVKTLRAYGGVALLLVASWNFLVLLAAFRSVVVPLKAIAMNVLSIGASYGLLVWVFQEGHGARWLGFEPLDGIDPTVPLVMFAIVFGLSMDYEVFLLSRIQEEWHRTRDNASSVLRGLVSTGRIITSAALILLVVVGAFAAGDLVYVKQIGVGISAAIVLDITLVRALLVPATMQLLGEWNWWAPRWLRPAAARAADPALVPPGPG